jgi:O-antigen/teichoic acid export membrane protein
VSTDRSILRGVFGAVALTAISAFASFLQFRFLVKWMPPQVVGLWFLFLSIGGYLALFDLGVSPTLGREISFCYGLEDLSPEERNRRISSLLKTCLGFFGFLALLLLVFGIFAGWAYLATVTPGPLVHEVRLAWVIFVFGAAIGIVGEVWFAAIYGMGQVATEKLLRSIGPVLWFILTVIALREGYGLPGLAFAWVLQVFVTRLIAAFALRRTNPGIFSLGKLDLGLLRRMAAPSMRYAATMLGGILILQTDNVVIASILGTAEIPGYQAVAKLVTFMMSLSMMLVVTTTPFLSKAHARQDLPEIKRLLNRSLRLSLGIMIVLGCFLACFADRIVALWLGPEHFVGFGVVWALIAVMLLEAHHTPMASATMATGEMAFVAPALIAGVLNIVASIYLGRHFGLLGVALGTLCAQVVTNNWYVPFYTMRQFGIGFFEHFTTILLPLGKLFVVLIGTGVAVRMATPNFHALPAALLGTVAMGSAGLLMFMVVVLSPEEKSQFIVSLQNSKIGQWALKSRPSS